MSGSGGETAPVPIPEPLTGQEWRHQRNHERRQRRGALVVAVLWMALVGWHVLHGGWAGAGNAALNAAFVLFAVVAPISGVMVAGKRMRAQAGRTDVPGMADAVWSGAASLGPDAAYELGTPSVQSGVGVLTVTIGLLRWVPDEQAALAGHRPWELIPAGVREIELTPIAKGAGVLRLVRPGRAIAVHLTVHPREGVLTALRAAGFAVDT